jgi:hypothetical protein
MKDLKKDLTSVAKNLRVLAQKTAKLAKELDKLEKPRAVGRPRAKRRARVTKKRVATRRRRFSAIDTVLGLIRASRKGVDTATLKKKTGFNEKKIWDIVNRAKRQGKVKALRKGVYAKA